MKLFMSNEKPRPAFDLADRLHSAAIHLLRRLRIQDLASGVGPAKLSALSVLVFSSRPLSLADLAAAEQVKPPTMSRLITSMAEEGLVRIRKSKDDARGIRITVTSRGKKLLLEGKRRRVESLAEALTELDPASLKRLSADIDLLRHVISRISSS
jgi:DNA-binding MarR family transcriptional regulator